MLYSQQLPRAPWLPLLLLFSFSFFFFFKIITIPLPRLPIICPFVFFCFLLIRHEISRYGADYPFSPALFPHLLPQPPSRIFFSFSFFFFFFFFLPFFLGPRTTSSSAPHYLGPQLSHLPPSFLGTMPRFEGQCNHSRLAFHFVSNLRLLN